MKLESLDLVDTIGRLREICRKLNVSKIIDGNADQIEMIVEIKERVMSLEVERIDTGNVDLMEYRA
tara:strand:+ start:243 stop:440 length:198 start_codon:yes stop_codon:yes gene_type:complete